MKRPNLTLLLLVTICAGSLWAAPSDIAGLKVWLDADRIAPVAEGTEVPLWPDASGNGLNGLPRGSVSSGTYVSNAIAGHAAVRFDYAANARYFEVAWGPSDGNDLTVFAVARTHPRNWPTAGSLFKPIVASGDPGYGNGLFCLYGVRGGVLQADASAAGCGGRGVQNDDAFTSGGNGILDNGRFHVLSMRMAGTLATNKLTECWFDGSAGESWQQALADPVNGNIWIGAAPGAGRNFHGDIAEVIIYDRGLDDGERRAVEEYLLRKYRIGGTLIACWTFDDPTTGAGRDSSGYNAHGLPVGAPLVIDDSATDPARDSVLELRGGANNSHSDHVDLSAYALALEYATNNTVAAWFKTAYSGAGVILAASDRNDGSSEARLFVESGLLRFDVREEGADPTSEVGQIVWTNAVNDASWHHAALTVNETNGAFLYVDGILRTSGEEPIIALVSNINHVSIGRNKDKTTGGGQWFFDGLVDDVRIYQRVLTTGEVAALASNVDVTNALILHYAFDSSTDGPGQSVGGFRGASGVGGTNGQMVVTDPQRGHVAYLRGRVLEHVSVVDASDLAPDIDGLAAGAISAWVRNPESSVGVATILAASDTSDQSSELRFFVDSNGIVHLDYREAGADAADRGVVTLRSVDDGLWHLVTATCDTSSNVVIYVDGEQDVAGSEAWFSSVNDIDNVAIGRNVDSGGGQWFYDGFLDDVTVSARVYTEAQARALYSLGRHDGTGLQYNPAETETLFGLHDTADEEAFTDIRGHTWWCWTGDLSGGRGEVQDLGGGRYALRLDAGGSGVATAPQPQGTLLIVR
jgi:hypothetical protein